MKKLTRERIYEIAGGNRSTYEIARAIEAEVLRLNGWQPIETAPMDGEEVLLGEQGSGDYELARWHADMGLWLDRCSDELHFTPTHWRDPMPPKVQSSRQNFDVHKVAMEQHSQYVIDQFTNGLLESSKITKPRVTGCHDTMDETAEIAVALKQAGEEKSPPATGPAG